jgi:histidinol-phosphate aminotransferase
LSANEFPYPPLPAVAAAARAAVAAGNRYPDASGTELSAAIAAHLRVQPSHVVTGAGSFVLVQQLIRATTSPGSQVVYAAPAFEGFPMLIGAHQAEPVAVPLTDERHDLAAMAAAVTGRTAMVIVCNPHNPTGTALRETELRHFLRELPRHVVVLLDEAYREFVRDPGVADGLALYREYPNVVVVRTFSKAHGLAGLRAGYALARDQVAAALRRVSLPYGVSAPAQAAALASLRVAGDVTRRCDELVIERERVCAALRRQGWTVPQPEGNFVWLRLGERTAEVTAACATAGVAIHQFPAHGVRVTIGLPVANDAFLEVIRLLAP